MKALKIVLTIILLIGFAVLAYALVRVYQDIRYANSYVIFVTDSTNVIISEVEEVNKLLDEISYNDGGEYVSELEGKLNHFNSAIEGIKKEKASFNVPYRGDEVEEHFNSYLSEGKEVQDAFEEVVNSIKNLDEKSDFEAKLEEYIIQAKQLDQKSGDVQKVLTEYANSYKKIDFERIIHEVKFI